MGVKPLRAAIAHRAAATPTRLQPFVLADGRTISILEDWRRGSQAEQDFLRDVHYTACQYFTTVLGPGYEGHEDHLHLDLARHNGPLL